MENQMSEIVAKISVELYDENNDEGVLLCGSPTDVAGMAIDITEPQNIIDYPEFRVVSIDGATNEEYFARLVLSIAAARMCEDAICSDDVGEVFSEQDYRVENNPLIARYVPIKEIRRELEVAERRARYMQRN
jgi:hypothetical protein